MENISKIKVYVVISGTSYMREVKDFEFSSKANADAFINLMTAEGYEITTFGKEGYLGAEAEQGKRDEKAAELQAEYQEKVEEVAEAFDSDNELDMLTDVADLYEAYLADICSLYECEAGVGDGFTLDLTCLGDEFFPGTSNIGYEEMAWQYDRLYSRIGEIRYAMEFEPVAR